MGRLENLAGAWALTLADELAALRPEDELAAADRAALITLGAYPGRTVSWLSDVLHMTGAGATRLLTRLADAGFVVRRPGVDGREREVRLTRSGTRRAGAVLRARDAALARRLAPLGTTERAQLEMLLDKLVAASGVTRLDALRTCRLCDRSACCTSGSECPLEHTVRVDDPHA